MDTKSNTRRDVARRVSLSAPARTIEGRASLVQPGGDARRSMSTLPHPPSIHHGALNRNVDDVVGVILKHVASQHDEVGQLPRLDRPLEVFFIRSVGAMHGSHTNRLFQRDLLLRPPD